MQHPAIHVKAKKLVPYRFCIRPHSLNDGSAQLACGGGNGSDGGADGPAGSMAEAF